MMSQARDECRPPRAARHNQLTEPHEKHVGSLLQALAAVVWSNLAADRDRDLPVDPRVVKWRHGFVNTSWDFIGSLRTPLDMCGLVQLARPLHQGDNHELSRQIERGDQIKTAYRVFGRGVGASLGPVASSMAEGYDDVGHHKLTRHIAGRSSPSARHQVADPPFSFACTTDGGLRPGCIDGWVYR